MACCSGGRRRGHAGQRTYKRGVKSTPRPGKRVTRRATKRAARRAARRRQQR